MSIRERRSRIVREPLLHLLVRGPALLGLQSAVSSRAGMAWVIDRVLRVWT